MSHGWPGTGYANGCRCEDCRAAHRARYARDRARRVAATNRNGGVAPLAKHGATTYTNWGCRCEVCRTANAVKSRLRRTGMRSAAKTGTTS